MSNIVTRLRAFLTSEIEKEVQHLKAIGGPTGMRNSQASALGLARNMVRQEILDMLPVNTGPFVLPSHCFDCGCYLMGGATEHKPGCCIGDMIVRAMHEAELTPY